MLKSTASLLYAALAAIMFTSCGREAQPVVVDDGSAQLADKGAHLATPTATQSAPIAAHAERRYLCEPGRCRVTGPLQARSIQEARWLIANGYPTEEEHDRLALLSAGQLKIEAESGNRAAEVFYGKKVATESDMLSGLTILRHAAESGSIFAYHGISEAYLEGPSPDRINSYAYLRLAYILGDGKAASALSSRDLTGIERVVADERALALYKTFSGERPPDVRPAE
ncbi:MAG: hypothetical protein RR704_09010 [Stenotrophomonas sp.]|uniref:hypothetical protein n=1 Tax=Stenotrophomonas sp. TaxID=69392 RepID=UPI002FC7CB2E